MVALLCTGSVGFFSVTAKILRADHPENPGDEKHERNNHEGLVHVAKAIIQNSDNDRRNHIAERVNEENIQREGGSPHRWMADIGKYRVGWPRIEEETETRKKEEHPDRPRKRGSEHQKK